MKLKELSNKIKAKFIKKRYGITPKELYNYFILKDGIEVYKGRIEILVLGSSHGQLGINTNLFENFKAFNLCIGSQDLYYSCELYKKYVKELKNLKNILLTYSVFSSGYELQKTKNIRYIDYYKEVFGIEPKYETEWGGVNHDKDIQIISELSKKKYYLPKGFTGYEGKVSPMDVNVAIHDIKSHMKNAFRDNHQEEYVKIMNDIAQENNQKLFVIIPPHSPIYREKLKEFAMQYGLEYNNIFKPLFDIGEKYDLKILNYYDNQNFTDEDFADYEHLLPTGAIKLTNMLLKEI